MRVLETEGVTVDEAKCVGCGICAQVCPAGVFEMKERAHGKKTESKYVARVKSSAVCQQCGGACKENCPTVAITI